MEIKINKKSMREVEIKFKKKKFNEGDGDKN